MFEMSDHDMSIKVMATELKIMNTISLDLSVFKLKGVFTHAQNLTHTHMLKPVVFHRVHGEWVGLSLRG